LIRVLTAIVLVALLAGTLWMPPYAFVVVLAIFLALGWSEYEALAAEAGAAPLRGLGALLAISVAVSFALPDPQAPTVALGASALLAALGGLAAGAKHPLLVVRRTVATLGGVCWLGLLPGFTVAIRFGDDGVTLIALLFAAVSSGDIAAYYGGTLLGRHPLAPGLSPKKTIEGTICGLLASGAGGALVAHYWLPDAGWSPGLAVGLMLGVAGQAGDLFESAFKRAANAKDSSRLLPGHGGILDRLDGLLFAGGVLYGAVFFGLF
jgi:phosphatidate cytidylyltransferase